MSLTSVELNYLIWRYLQESGFELSAYAFSKDSACLEYDHNKNKLIPAIEPGSLVNLVQKGILYTLLDVPSDDKESRLNLLEAILKDKADFDAFKNSVPSQDSKAPLNSNPADEDSKDVEMADAADFPSSSGDNNSAQNGDLADSDMSFQTNLLRSFITFPSSLSSDWHPTSDVFAIGNENSTAVINALGPTDIAETVTLNHPPVIGDGHPIPSTISVISWSPQGSIVLTAGVGGEIRAWAPDGRLKNIANAVPVSENAPAPAIISSIVWNSLGSLVLSVDVQNNVSLWEGSTLTHLQDLHNSEEGPSGESLACWLGDSKFAMSSSKNAIKIVSVNPALPNGEILLPVAQLSGHENVITNLCFSPVSKLLASASDVDYAIKVWNSSSSLDALELNTSSENPSNLQHHISPIIALKWLSRLGDVEGNELLSISMEGTVNIWDAFTGDALVSANVFTNPDNFQFSLENEDFNIVTKNSLVFAAAVSPDSKYLAVGDDSGNVSIWDIYPGKYKETSDHLRCLGVFAMEKDEATAPAEVGICDLVWDKNSHFITVCYKGTNSVIIKWEYPHTSVSTSEKS